MSTTRTNVGIVEWAARARRARTVEMLLADTLGDSVVTIRDPSAKVVLARHARHHAFHAALWDTVVPALHDVAVSGDPSDDRGLADVVVAIRGAEPADAFQRVLVDGLPALVAVYREWARDTSVIADRPVMRVLDLVLRDEEFDAREGEALAQALPS